MTFLKNYNNTPMSCHKETRLSVPLLVLGRSRVFIIVKLIFRVGTSTNVHPENEWSGLGQEQGRATQVSWKESKGRQGPLRWRKAEIRKPTKAWVFPVAQDWREWGCWMDIDPPGMLQISPDKTRNLWVSGANGIEEGQMTVEEGSCEPGPWKLAMGVCKSVKGEGPQAHLLMG